MSNDLVLLVGGTWDEGGGRPSSVVAQMAQSMCWPSGRVHLFNGGYFKQLAQIAETANLYRIVIWMAHVPDNDKEKIVREIKHWNPTATFVTSKRNDRDKYTFPQLVSHALQLKANMFIEIAKGPEGRFIASLYDSLSNLWEETDNFADLAETLSLRLRQLQSYTRVRSTRVGPAKEIPDEPEFFEACREYGTKFHEMIHAANTTRFLGNISFRCDRGFPAFVQDGLIYVSRRNIDKRHIGRDGFVAVDVARSISERGVFYYGDCKPSVDAPVQVGLFKWYTNIRYMMHSHVYIKGAPMTSEAMPCGALEELDAIIDMFPDQETDVVTINLRGHGSIIMADRVSAIREVSYTPRPRPELQDIRGRNLREAKC